MRKLLCAVLFLAPLATRAQGYSLANPLITPGGTSGSGGGYHLDGLLAEFGGNLRLTGGGYALGFNDAQFAPDFHYPIIQLNPAGLAEDFSLGVGQVALSVPSATYAWTAQANANWLHLNPGSLAGLGNSSLSFVFDANPGRLRVGSLSIAGQTLLVTQYGVQSLAASAVFEGPGSGADTVRLDVYGNTDWTAQANAPWLHLAPMFQAGMGSDTVAFQFDTNPGPTRTGTLTIHGQTLAVTQAGWPAAGFAAGNLGTAAVLEGPDAGADSVVLAIGSGSPWTAQANDAWLHLDTAAQSGTGSGNVVFRFDANSGPTRVGTLSVAGQTLTVTQAGAGYRRLTAGFPVSVLGTYPSSLAVDAAGNVYGMMGWPANGVLVRWAPQGNSFAVLAAGGAASAAGLVADGAGNVFIADTGHNAIKWWSPSLPDALLTLVDTGLAQPGGLALDRAGSLYIADTGNHAIKQWSPAHPDQLTTLVAAGLSAPQAVAVDAAGNVYIADTGNNAVKKWSPFDQSLTTLPIAGLGSPTGIAVDGTGSLFVGDGRVSQWSPADGSVTVLVDSGYFGIDAPGNLYFTEPFPIECDALPHAFLPPGRRVGRDAGSDQLVVLPATINLNPPFPAVTSDQTWLTITGVSQGVVRFDLQANASGADRTANVQILGQSIPVTQAGLPGGAPSLIGIGVLPGLRLQFAFSGTVGAHYTVLSTTNLTLPAAAWDVIGTATNTSSNQFEFIAPPGVGQVRRFFQVRTP